MINRYTLIFFAIFLIIELVFNPFATAIFYTGCFVFGWIIGSFIPAMVSWVINLFKKK